MDISTLITFILAAVVINVLLYGGVTWAYFDDKGSSSGKAETPIPVVAHDEVEAPEEHHRAA